MQALLGLGMIAMVVIGPIVWLNWWGSTYDQRHWAQNNTRTVVFPDGTSARLQGVLIREDGREVAIQNGEFYDIYELHTAGEETIYVGHYLRVDPEPTQQGSRRILRHPEQAKFYEGLNRRR